MPGVGIIAREVNNAVPPRGSIVWNHIEPNLIVEIQSDPRREEVATDWRLSDGPDELLLLWQCFEHVEVGDGRRRCRRVPELRVERERERERLRGLMLSLAVIIRNNITIV